MKNAELLQQKVINMIKTLFAVFVFVTLNATAQPNPSPQQMQVMMKMQNLKKSLIAKDSVSLMSLIADDVNYGHTNGLIQTKAQLIRSVMSGDQDYKKIEPSDMIVRIYENTSVVTMKSKVSMVFHGKPLDMDMFVTLTWVKMNGDWKLVARQSVKQN